MYCKGFFKRAVPFFLTFFVGVMIASIFLPLTGSNFQFRKNRWQRHREYHERMESEIQQLREENERLRQQLEEKQEFRLEIPNKRILKVKTVNGEIERVVTPPVSVVEK
jgi:hypothetical protein